MGAPPPDSKSVRLAIAAVFAFFGFLVAFFTVADRFGGWPIGFGVAFAMAGIIFLVVMAIAPRVVAMPLTPTPRVAPAPSHPITIVQTPILVSVPVDVQVRTPEAEKPSGPLPNVKEKILTPRPVAPAGKNGAPFVDSLPAEETLFDETVEVKPGREGAWSFELPLQIGDTLEGNLREEDLETFN